jgi:hypothetical protein
MVGIESPRPRVTALPGGAPEVGSGKNRVVSIQANRRNGAFCALHEGSFPPTSSSGMVNMNLGDTRRLGHVSTRRRAPQGPRASALPVDAGASRRRLDNLSWQLCPPWLLPYCPLSIPALFAREASGLAARTARVRGSRYLGGPQAMTRSAHNRGVLPRYAQRPNTRNVRVCR